MSVPAEQAADRCRFVLNEVAQIGDFFALDRPDLAGIPLRRLVDSSEVYHARIDATGIALSRLLNLDPDELPRRPLASLAFLGISARLVAPALAAAAIYRLVPELTLDNVNEAELAVGRVVLHLTEFHGLDPTPTSEIADLADLIDGHLLQGPLAGLVSAFAAREALHPRLLWGNVASTVASSAKLVGRHRPGHTDTTNELARLILDRTPLSECGYLTQDDQVLDYHRRSCCLYYQFPNAGTCGDCPLPPGPHPVYLPS
jgi:ferric iron reductase protein FhuF